MLPFWYNNIFHMCFCQFDLCFWSCASKRPSQDLSSHLLSHLHLWIGHRVPQVWLILVDVDKAGICGAVKHYLGQADKSTTYLKHPSYGKSLHPHFPTGSLSLGLSLLDLCVSVRGTSLCSLEILALPMKELAEEDEKQLQGPGLCHGLLRPEGVMNTLG